ncbi:ABC transporter permease [Cloacibacillus porcorum]|uniref:ABC transporter permease n=1 Tax=Cloacibacillus porcorum TaxID=1197717 RepID=UPI002355DFAF|nr:iron ABC transporter permease [Cloacibacillus porcorum]MCI5864492.1 iron ABC transporter permease [Cloacibacillus porcorum]MDD7649356.1 iron ABC transporter permease [Cloacibacillus porcorum]MDY4094004.1 iron ABC transporter permease [Cloacibacillus porcorum]
MTSSSSMRRDPALIPVVVTLWLALGLFIVYPFIKLLMTTFIVDGRLSLDNLMLVFSNSYDRLALINSIWLAVTVAAMGTFLGFVFALAVTRIHLPAPLRWFIAAVTILPLISPPFTSSIALTLSLGPNGIILKFFGIPDFNIYGFWGTWISESLTYFPVAFLTITSVLACIDPNLEDAGLSLGGSPFRVFRTVTLPLTMPAIANSILLLFACSLADFATPLVLAGHQFPVLPTQAYLQITGMYDLKGGAALSFALLVPALLVFVLQRFWVSRKSYVTVSGKSGAQTTVKGIGMAGTAVVMAICAAVIAFILFLYALIVMGAFTKAWGLDNSFTWESFAYVFDHGRKAMIDTLIIACISTPIGGLLAVSIAYVTQRKSFPANGLMEFVSLLNFALPGTVVGIAYIIAFNSSPIVLTGTMSIIVAAYVFRYDSAGIRSVIASLHQIDPSLEEASLSLGASSIGTFKNVTLPLVIPALLAGMKYLFIHSMTAISATIFLVSVSWSLLTARILECMTELQFGNACAFSVVLILLVFIFNGMLTLLVRAAGYNYRGQGGNL